jgi:hypothetical protein
MRYKTLSIFCSNPFNHEEAFSSMDREKNIKAKRLLIEKLLYQKWQKWSAISPTFMHCLVKNKFQFFMFILCKFSLMLTQKLLYKKRMKILAVFSLQMVLFECP